MNKKDMLEKIFEGVSPSFLAFCKKRGILDSLEKKIDFFLKSKNFSEDSLNVFFEAVRKEFITKFVSIEEIDSFLEEIKKLENNLLFLKNKIDPILIKRTIKNLDETKNIIKKYKESEQKILNNLKKILKDIKNE